MFDLNAKTLLLAWIGYHVICICYGKSQSLEGIQNIFEALGYSPSCIAVALATCSTNKQTFPYLLDLNKSMTNKTLPNNPRNCADLQALGDMISGVRTVYPFACCTNRPVSVVCDQTTDGGGWTVIQRRDALPQREDFYRTWVEYVLGFGNLTGEFWLGLDKIHALVSSTLMELRIDLEDFEGERRWAKYGLFHVGDSESKYFLNIGRYLGDAGDSLTGHNGFMFTTHDADHDTHASLSCAKLYRGGWWYNHCHSANLNGFQHEGIHTTYADGINWHHYKGVNYSLKVAVMSVRPKFKIN